MKNQLFVGTLIFVMVVFSKKTFCQSNSKKFKHIVTFTFTTNATQPEIEEIDKSFKGLAKLKVVKSYEWGIAPITERNKENRHTYAFTFSSFEDFGKYADSPEHQKHIKVGANITKQVEAVQYFVAK